MQKRTLLSARDESVFRLLFPVEGIPVCRAQRTGIDPVTVAGVGGCNLASEHAVLVITAEYVLVAKYKGMIRPVKFGELFAYPPLLVGNGAVVIIPVHIELVEQNEAGAIVVKRVGSAVIGRIDISLAAISTLWDVTPMCLILLACFAFKTASRTPPPPVAEGNRGRAGRSDYGRLQD